MAYFQFVLLAVTAVLVLAWLLTRFVVSRPAARDLIWRTALVVVAITPLLPVVRGACSPWQLAVAVLPPEATEAAGSRYDAPVAPPPSRKAAPETGATIEPIPEAPFILPRAPQIAELEVNDIPSSSAVDAPVAYHPAGVPEAQVDSSSGPVLTWPLALAALWLLGTFFHTVRLVLAAWNARRLTTLSVPVEPLELINLNAWAAQRVGLKHPTALRSSAQIGVPVVAGLWRPAILVPPTLTTDEARPQLRAALLHEYGHVRRHDVAFEVLLKIVVAALWPHPLVHWMSRELRRLREEICDNYVLAEESPVAYSELLLRLSVGLRLNDAGLVGLGMFSNINRLEARIDSLLAPGRSIETRSRPAARRILLAGTSVALLAALVVRFERAAAAPPTATVDKAASRDQIANDKSGDLTATKTKESEKSAPLREFRFRVVTASSKPVAGAKVTVSGVTYRSAGIGFQEKDMASATTDANGDVTVVFTPAMNASLTAIMQHAGVAGIQWVYLKVEHPDHPDKNESFQVGSGVPIVLADPIAVRVRARRAGEATPVSPLFPILAPRPATEWDEAEGRLTIRRVDVSSSSASRWLRVAHVAEDGKAWLSEVIDLKPIAGNPIDVDLDLHPTIRVTGKLDAMVPRPVKNGRVNAIAVDDADDPANRRRDNAWGVLADVAADGTFVIEALPASARHLQLVALCDGWVSRSPTNEESKNYETRHGYPASSGMDRPAGITVAQIYPLNGSESPTPVVAMEPSAACEVTVLDPQGKPLPEASVAFFPNQHFHGFGSNLLGDGYDQLTFIRDRLASGERSALWTRTPTLERYSATTNADGVALVTGLAAAGDGPQATRLASFFVQHPGYVAESNYQTPGIEDTLQPILVTGLTRGKMERVTVRMRPDPTVPPGALATAMKGAAPAPAAGKTELAGRVVNEKGEPLEGVQVLTFNQDCFNIRTGKDGRFRHTFDEEMFADNPTQQKLPEELSHPGQIDIRFVTPGYAPMTLVMRAGLPEQTVTLQNNTYFEGFVRLPDGTPAKNVRVRGNQELHSAGGFPGYEEVWTETQTDDRGHYRLLVQPGAFVIAAGNPGEAIAWLPGREPLATKMADSDILSLQDRPERPRLSIFGSEVKKLDINLKQGVDLQFRFVDSTSGRPVPNVSLWQREYPDQQEYPNLSGESDENGLITLRSIPAGEIIFSMTAKGYLRAWSDAAAPNWKEAHNRRRPDGTPARMALMQDGIRFDLRPGMPNVTVVLEPPVTIQGRVLDPEGQPVSRALVRLVRSAASPAPTSTEEFHERTETKEDGRFSLTLPPSDGHPYSLMVHDGARDRVRDRDEQAEPNRFDEYEWRTWANGILAGPSINTGAGQQKEGIELRLSPPGTIRGRLVDKSGKPVARAPVHSVDVDGREGVYHHPIGRSDGDGHFEIRFVRPGRHRVYRGRPNGTQAAAITDAAIPIIEVRAGETTDAGEVSAVADKAR